MSRPIVVIVCMDAPPNRGSFNSAHIFGTHVPVEEPSTSSIGDICAAATNDLFDHLVGADERLGRKVYTETGSRLLIYDRLEVRGRFDRRIARRCPAKNLDDIGRHPSHQLLLDGPVG